MKRIEFTPRKVEFVPDPIMDVKKPRTDKMTPEKRKEVAERLRVDYKKKAKEATVIKEKPITPERQTFSVVESRVASEKEIEDQKPERKRRVEVEEPEVVTQEQSTDNTQQPRVIIQPTLPFNRREPERKRTIEIETLPSPGDPIDWKNVGEMVSYGCNETEVAGLYCITIPELKARCLTETKKTWEVFQDQYDALFRRNLKMMQYKKAVGHMRKGTNGKEYFIPSDSLMLAHLGKHVLGQNDKDQGKQIFAEYLIEDFRDGKQIRAGVIEELPKNIIDGVAVISLDEED